MKDLYVIFGACAGFVLGAAVTVWLTRTAMRDARRSSAHMSAALREALYELSRIPCPDEECDGPGAAINPDTCDRCTAVARGYERLLEPVPPLCSVCKAGPVVRLTEAGEFCEQHRLHRSTHLGEME